MKYLERLLAGAPVEWKRLGEVAELKRGRTITKKTSTVGIYPVISGGQQPAYYVDQYNQSGEIITVAGSGAYAGLVSYWAIPIFVGDAFSIKVAANRILPRYLYHYLLSIQEKIYNLKSGGGVPHVYAKDVACFCIPLPPLSVQEEIVRILDKFTELEAELEARAKQYKYYRNKLLTFGDEVEWKPLGEVAEYEQPTNYLVQTTHYNDAFTTPVLTAGKTFILGYTAESIGIYRASINPVIIFDDFTTANKWVDFDFKVKSSAMKILTSKDEKRVLLKYIYYWLNTLPNEVVDGDHKRQWISNFCNKSIPLPPLSVQEEIVRILDKFHTLTSSIVEGLPREIELRRKQYEYYREKLLTFPLPAN